MKPVDAKDNAYIDSSKEVNDKDLKFKVGDYVRISKYQIGLKVFVIKEAKNTVPWTYVNDLNYE